MKEHFAREVFGADFAALNQWQVQMVQMMKTSMDRSSFTHAVFMGRDQKWCGKNEIGSTDASLTMVRETAAAIDPVRFEELMRSGYTLKTSGIDLATLSEADADASPRPASTSRWRWRWSPSWLAASSPRRFRCPWSPSASASSPCDRHLRPRDHAVALLVRRHLVHHGQPHVRRRLRQDRGRPADRHHDVRQAQERRASAGSPS